MVSRIGYNLLPLDSIVAGLLREERSDRVRTVDKWFICERCSGGGKMTARSTIGAVLKGTLEDCDLCSGTGKIQLRLSAERIK